MFSFFSEITDIDVIKKYLKSLALAFRIFKPKNGQMRFSDDKQFDLFMTILLTTRDNELIQKYIYRVLSECLKCQMKKEHIQAITEAFWNDSMFTNLLEENIKTQQAKITFALILAQENENYDMLFSVLDFLTEQFESLHLTVKISFLNYVIEMEFDEPQVFEHIIDNGLIHKIFLLIESNDYNTIRAVAIMIEHVIKHLDQNQFEVLKEIVINEDWLGIIEESKTSDDSPENNELDSFSSMLLKRFLIEDQ